MLFILVNILKSYLILHCISLTLPHLINLFVTLTNNEVNNQSKIQST